MASLASQGHLGYGRHLDRDKQQAFYCYKGYKAYQPLNVYWHESLETKDLMLYAEFRDGHCPASWRNLEVFKAALAQLPAGVKQVRLRTDTAGYQVALLTLQLHLVNPLVLHVKSPRPSGTPP